MEDEEVSAPTMVRRRFPSLPWRARRRLSRVRFEGRWNGPIRKQVDVHFYAELNDFLAPWRKGGATPRIRGEWLHQRHDRNARRAAYGSGPHHGERRAGGFHVSLGQCRRQSRKAPNSAGWTVG